MHMPSTSHSLCSMLIREAESVCWNDNNMSKYVQTYTWGHLQTQLRHNEGQITLWTMTWNNSETSSIDFWSPVAIFPSPQMAFKFLCVLCFQRSCSPMACVHLFSILPSNVTTEPNQELLMMIENIAGGNKSKHTDNAELMKWEHSQMPPDHVTKI